MIAEQAATNVGDMFAVRCSVKLDAGDVDRLTVRAQLFNAAGAKVTNMIAETVDDPVTGQWYDMGGVVGPVAAAGVVSSVARADFMGITGAFSGNVDQCMLVVNPPGNRLPAYFDGRTGGAWQGAADASPSDGSLAQRISRAE